MKGRSSSDKMFQALRQKAEQLLAQGDVDTPAVDGADIVRLVHELEVHQVELEMQNEELRRAKAEADTLREEFSDLYECAPLGYVTLSEQGRIEKANQVARGLLKVTKPPAVGSSLSQCVSADDIFVYHAFMKQLTVQRTAGPVEMRLNSQAGPVYVLLEGATKIDPETGRKDFRLALVNISRLKTTEQALVEARNHLEKRVAERTHELGQEVERRRFLSERLVDLLESERRGISMDLHEDIGQILAGVNLQMEILKGIKIPEGRSVGEAVNPSQEMLGEAMKRLRTISYGLRSEVLSRFGLVPALKTLAERFEKQHHIPVRLTTKAIPEPLAEDLSLTIYRIVQESLNNILRHARAQTVFIHLGVRDRSLFLTIEDDGIGFNYDQVLRAFGPTGCALGLIIMRERAAMAGGEFYVETSPGRGTHIRLQIPVKLQPQEIGNRR